MDRFLADCVCVVCGWVAPISPNVFYDSNIHNDNKLSLIMQE